MAPIAKETDVLSSGPGASPRPEEGAGRTQPVALEVSVTVNGARTVDGSDKREPFSETSKTVLIFANGAVIRLASTVAPGQLLFLTNENTKKEVVCQVVKSKNYRSVSGYVELEFTEPAQGFWGMRFPTERTTPAPQASASAPASVPSAAPRANTPAPASLSTTPAPVSQGLPPVSKAQPPAPPAEAARTTTTPTRPQTAAPPERPASDPETEALKQEAARLQEQLSGLLFTQNAGPKAQTPKTEAPVPETKAKVIEMTPRPDSAGAGSTAKPAATAPAQKSTLDLAAEEMKIPAWLEPLARNAATPAVEVPAYTEEAGSNEPVSVAEASEAGNSSFSSEGPTPTFGGSLFAEESTEPTAASGKSGKGVLIGLVAAGVIAAAAAGTWYFGFRHPASATPQNTAPVFATLPASPSSSAAQNSQPASAAAQPNSFAANSGVAASNPRATETLRTTAGGNPPPVVNARETEKIEANRNATVGHVSPETIAEQPKKPALGDVTLAAPTVNAQQVSAGDVSAPHIGGGTVATGGDAMGSELVAGNNSQPVAPVPVGGEVKSARLLHSVPPVYPPLARSQRVSGDVRIDALVDATGHVTTMKIVSGPVLLHQAAKDALHQWRYQPAMLDGKPVPMHLTVTVQFRLQ